VGDNGVSDDSKPMPSSGVSGFGTDSKEYSERSKPSVSKREARANDSSCWRSRMSQSTSSSKIRALLRFWWTTLIFGQLHSKSHR